MITSILFAFILSVLSVIVAGMIIGLWIIYRRFTQSADCYKMLENILIKIHENKYKLK